MNGIIIIKNNLSNILNDCIILENNIKKINEIKLNIEKAKIKYNNEIDFNPKEESEINIFIEKINNFGKIKFIFNTMASNIILGNTQGNGEIKIDEITKEEIKDPDNIKYLNTLGALDCKIKKLEDKRNNIDGRTPKELMQEINEITTKRYNLKKSLGFEIKFDDYKNLLIYTFYHNKKLLEYFKNNKEQKKAKLVSKRLSFIIKEMEKHLGLNNSQEEEEEEPIIIELNDIIL